MPYLLRLFHTVRHLRVSQVFVRARRRVSRPRVPALAVAPQLRPARLTSLPRPSQSSWKGQRRFEFLAEPGDLRDIGWVGRGKSALWVYNLHYFDFLVAVDSEQDEFADVIDLMREWVASCPPGSAVAWDPYPASRRIVNWLKFGLRCGGLPDDLLLSLGHQAAWLRRTLEYDILGNHLFANAKALTFAGMCLAHTKADDWLRVGRRLVREQLAEQFLPDGAHFELSPMYHSTMLEDVLDLVALAKAYSDHEFERVLSDTARSAFDWLAAMCHDDGDISFFNDSAFGIARTPSELRTLARLLALEISDEVPGPQWLSSGYARLRGRSALVIADIAPVGPDYQPGHAHADTLSFEFSLGAQRVVVNAGTSVYGVGAEREAQRATRAHSTVEIGGLNSSDVWASFRVGARARARLLRYDKDGVAGQHDGYRSLPGRPVHRRAWTLNDTSLEVCDTIIGAKPILARIRFHLPSGVVGRSDEHGVALTLSDGRTVTVRCTLPLSIQEDRWFSHFGVARPSQTLCAEWNTAETKEIVTIFEWEFP